MNPQDDPVGFISLWWSCFTDLSSQGCPVQREWAHKYRYLTDQARKRPGPTSEILVQGLRRWPSPPRGFEGLQHGQTLHDSIPSPWHTHPWTGTPLQDAPVTIALWRMATWSWVHETGRFRSEHLRQWIACLWPEISWDALLDWVRTPGITDLGIHDSATEDDGALHDAHPWRTCFRDTYCHVHIQTKMPVESWARHPPPSSFRRWQEYALRSAAGGLLSEAWSDFFYSTNFIATNSRLVYYTDDPRPDSSTPGAPLAWTTWTQVLVAHIVQRGDPHNGSSGTSRHLLNRYALPWPARPSRASDSIGHSSAPSPPPAWMGASGSRAARSP